MLYTRERELVLEARELYAIASVTKTKEPYNNMKALGEKNDIPIFSGIRQTMWLKEGS